MSIGLSGGSVLLLRSLLFVVHAEVAVLTDTFGVEGSIRVMTLRSFFCPSLRVVAVLAHAISVIRGVLVTTLADQVSVLLLLDNFCFLISGTFNQGINSLLIVEILHVR